MTKKQFGSESWGMTRDSNGFYVFCDAITLPHAFIVDELGANAFWLGLLGKNFISSITETLKFVSCTSSCFSNGSACTCGAEQTKKEAEELIQFASRWVDGSYWTHFNKKS